MARANSFNAALFSQMDTYLSPFHVFRSCLVRLFRQFGKKENEKNEWSRNLKKRGDKENTDFFFAEGRFFFQDGRIIEGEEGDFLLRK